MEEQINLRYPLRIQLFNDEDNDNFDDEDFDEENDESKKETKDKEEKSKDEESKESSKSKEEEPKETDSTQKKQGREENARQAELRRQKVQKEREEQLKREAYLKGQLDVQKTNTFTNKPIKDEHDLNIFKLQLELSAKGQDPIEDLPDALAEQARVKAEQELKQVEEKKKHDLEVAEDIKNFETKYKDIKAKELLDNERFRKFFQKFVGKNTLVDIYEAYQDLQQETIAELKAKAKAKKEAELAKQKGTAPSASGGQSKIEKSYSAMSKEEKVAYLKAQNLI